MMANSSTPMYLIPCISDSLIELII
jgi:hypothetical protein